MGIRSEDMLREGHISIEGKNEDPELEDHELEDPELEDPELEWFILTTKPKFL